MKYERKLQQINIGFYKKPPSMREENDCNFYSCCLYNLNGYIGSMVIKRLPIIAVIVSHLSYQQ